MICHVPGVENGIKGVIYGVPLSLNDEVLRNQITCIKVTEVKRLASNRNGKREMCTTVVMGMNEKILPVNVKIGFMSNAVRTYIKPALRCLNCQRLGHVAEICKGKKGCCKRGGEHDLNAEALIMLHILAV